MGLESKVVSVMVFSHYYNITIGERDVAHNFVIYVSTKLLSTSKVKLVVSSHGIKSLGLMLRGRGNKLFILIIRHKRSTYYIYIQLINFR